MWERWGYRKMASEPLTLAQLASAVGMSTSDVQLYQQRGLLDPPKRTPTRRLAVAYRQEHVDRLRFIGRALAYGFSLGAIERIVTTSGLVTCRDIRDIADTELERLRELMGPDAPVVGTLAQLKDRCPGTGAREDCLIYAALAGDDPDAA
jgi:DNA-binding transcriptional MerR regulator